MSMKTVTPQLRVGGEPTQQSGTEYMASAELRGFWGNGAGRVIVSNVQSPALVRNMVQSPCRTGIREQAHPRTGKTEPRQAKADRDVHVCGETPDRLFRRAAEHAAALRWT